jgi:hypothetical protein
MYVSLGFVWDLFWGGAVAGDAIWAHRGPSGPFCNAHFKFTIFDMCLLRFNAFTCTTDTFYTKLLAFTHFSMCLACVGIVFSLFHVFPYF